MLKMTKIELKLISNIHIYLFVEKEMIGGISYIAKRLSKANINTWNRMIIVSQANILHIWMQVIDMIEYWSISYLRPI